ncbi:class I SAM-dependent methyltransferase [Undibacterium flavidum]|uniref:Methyltransferase regulatory domain-containing protein n=1 Tax=Undibacterium flavidum TaxID=2762297 RepID=A0ABR6YH06_9BURK|nr:class I SAM-dependent methyltransferase [Undibacterium flavidum]MBC3875797.1 methyltransferase regulatory domain-containing protein [Undibacterium flavidum]
MDWTAGYASGVEYTSGFYREQSPAYLNFVSILNRCEPIPLDQPFTYFELGFGQGLTINLLAASNPQGQFYAADFTPAHVANARQLANSAKLTNLTLLENSFAELAQGDVQGLPQFDFITLHGIYSWVSPESRQHMVDFIARYLKPGGIVYVSYNAMPGWAAALPLQRLLMEHANLFPNDGLDKIMAGRAFLEKLTSTNASYIQANPGLNFRLESITNNDAKYLVHEYLNNDWSALYHADVARDMSQAKLDYIGSADLLSFYENLYLSEEKIQVLNTIPNAIVRETIKDYYLNNGFRKDVYTRGARMMSTLRQNDWIDRLGLALMIPRDRVSLKIKLGSGAVDAKPELYNPVLDLLAERPCSLSELKAMLFEKFQTNSDILQIAAILMTGGIASIYFIPAPDNKLDDNHTNATQQASQAINRTIAWNARYGDEHRAFASPLLGNGVAMTIVERMAYSVIAKQKSPDLGVKIITEEITKLMKETGVTFIKEGKRIESSEENIAFLEVQVIDILKNRLPLWRQLQLL